LPSKRTISLHRVKFSQTQNFSFSSLCRSFSPNFFSNPSKIKFALCRSRFCGENKTQICGQRKKHTQQQKQTFFFTALGMSPLHIVAQKISLSFFTQTVNCEALEQKNKKTQKTREKGKKTRHHLFDKSVRWTWRIKLGTPKKTNCIEMALENHNNRSFFV